MFYTIDRIEGEYASCEDEGRIILDILIKDLPEGIREGDVVEYSGGNYILCDKEKSERLIRIRSKLNKLFKNK